METEELRKKFTGNFPDNSQSPSLFFTPGRVNLIGEHTDYNGGYVFPCALSFGTYLAVAVNGLDKFRFVTGNFEFKTEINLADAGKKIEKHWVNYPLGVINQFLSLSLKLPGIDFYYFGNIPNGAGLSSSASIEVVTAFALNSILAFGIPVIELVKMCQKAENQFVGVNCGIMDQFAVGMGKRDHAIYLDCSSLDYKLVPVKLKGYKLVISNTNKRRGLADSKYNERRAECDKAVEFLSKGKAINLLGELNMEEFDQLSYLIPDGIVKKRAKHVVSEIARTNKAVDCLQRGDLEEFGRLMNASHDSLRQDYEVTGDELDALVEEARRIPGVIGSRMTGAGFGGCTVSLVAESSIHLFIDQVGKNYNERTGLKADFYVAEVGDGAKELS
ncbi:MAG: galactokinase [Bacteroidales bacterium]